MKTRAGLLETLLAGLIFLCPFNNAKAGECSKSFPVTLNSANLSAVKQETRSQVRADVKFKKADSDYYSHNLEVILYTEDYNKEKNFYEYITIAKNRSQLHVMHNKEIKIGTVNEEVFLSKMIENKMTGKWYTINPSDENNYKTIRRTQRYLHDFAKIIGKYTEAESVMEDINDGLCYFEDLAVNENLDKLRKKYFVTEIPYHSPPSKGEITAWKFIIKLIKTGDSPHCSHPYNASSAGPYIRPAG